MATSDISDDADSFLHQVARIRSEIETKTKFRQLIDQLNGRKVELLKDLDTIHKNYQQENKKHEGALSEVAKSLKFTQENFQSFVMKDAHSGIIKSLEKKRKVFEHKFRIQQISIEFDNSLLDMINEFGKIRIDNSNDSYLPVVQYTGKVRPVLSVGTAGSGKGEFNLPWGVVEERSTENIYIADRNNNRILVLNRDAEYLFEFGSDQMNLPLYIVIYKDRVFVTQYGGGCVLVFDLNGKFLQQIGTLGSGVGQLYGPYGIAIHHTNGDIYVCDYYNRRMQIFSSDYSYKCQFGMNVINAPLDIQLTEDSIFVLSHNNPYLYTINYNLTQVNNIVCDSICKQLNNPYSFFIDGAGNFIISDYNSNNVVIFDKTGHLIHKLTVSISQPIGVTLNSNGGIIVVGHNNRLLIF